ncbi:hypothetical protein [Marinobacterium sp. MBR-109]|uniref:hypothetical protein n=1 Tax=Marinobacterium sp. MBR-109 TaxID=3156462 RepID=UPI00339596AA
MAKKTSENSNHVPGWFVLLVLITFGAFIWYKANTPPSSKTSKSDPQKVRAMDEFDALVTCQNHVKRNLKSPSSAKFPVMQQIKVYSTGPDEWLIRGYVDADNSFGANIRSHYECKTKYSGTFFSILDFQFMN